MSDKEEFIKNVIKLVDKWSFDHCAYCDPGTLVSVDGMVDFECINCGRKMRPEDYLGGIARLVYELREGSQNQNTEADE